MLIFEPAVCRRARRAWKCSPFQGTLFEALRDRGVSLGEIKGESGLHRGFTRRSLTEGQAEAELMWLIRVGVLRREVDGQGITDSYRLAPLGRYLLQELQTGKVTPVGSRVTLIDVLLNRLTQLGIRLP